MNVIANGVSGLASNYSLQTPSENLTADIAQAALTVSGSVAANKTYDGTTTAQVSGGTLQGLVAREDLALTQSGGFIDKNAGAAKAVTGTNVIANGVSGLASNYSQIGRAAGRER